MTPKFDNIAYLNRTEIGHVPTFVQTRYGDSCTKSVVEVPRLWKLGQECIKVLQQNTSRPACYVHSRQFSSAYLASILNSYLGLRFLLGTTVRRMQIIQVDDTDLIKVPIFIADNNLQKKLGDLQLLIQALYESNEKNVLSRMMVDLFENVRDGMVLELYFSDEFKKRGINIWESWDKTVNQNSLKVDSSNVMKIYEQVKGLSSPVRRSLKNLQVLRNSPNFKF